MTQTIKIGESFLPHLLDEDSYECHILWRETVHVPILRRDDKKLTLDPPTISHHSPDYMKEN